MANDLLVKWLTVRHRPDDVWAIVPLLPEPVANPTVQEAEDAPQASSTAPAPAAVPFAPRQNGVFGWREEMVPLESNAQSSFCLAPWPHGSEGMQRKPAEVPCQLQVCGGGHLVPATLRGKRSATDRHFRQWRLAARWTGDGA